MARTKEFDPDEALLKAHNLFWLKGYHATTMKDLVATMGIKRQSLYDTFGDKESLFSSVLELYSTETVQPVLELLTAAPTGGEGIRRYLYALRDFSLRRDTPNACLIANSVLERGDDNPEVALLCRVHFERVESVLLSAVRSARASGEVTSAQSDVAIARHLTVVAHGFSMVSKAGVTRDYYDDVIDSTLSCLGVGFDRVSDMPD